MDQLEDIFLDATALVVPTPVIFKGGHTKSTVMMDFQPYFMKKRPDTAESSSSDEDSSDEDEEEEDEEGEGDNDGDAGAGAADGDGDDEEALATVTADEDEDQNAVKESGNDEEDGTDEEGSDDDEKDDESDALSEVAEGEEEERETRGRGGRVWGRRVRAMLQSPICNYNQKIADRSSVSSQGRRAREVSTHDGGASHRAQAAETPARGRAQGAAGAARAEHRGYQG